MQSSRRLLLGLLQVLVLVSSTVTVSAAAVFSTPASSSAIHGSPNSFWYDWGLYGLHPEQHYTSFSASPPRPYLLQSDARCSSSNADGTSRYTFVSPRGLAVTTPGPIIYDGQGNLVWMDTRWGEAMDFKAQRYRGEDYLTFWHGSDNGTFGEGQYYMLNSTYDVAHIVRPAGNFSGDLHEFRITDEGTALMTMYQKVRVDLTKGYGIKDGWIIDSMFQEIDIATGRLLFQWRASEQFPVHDSQAPIRSMGRSEDRAFDYFHINSVDKTADGDYIISSRYMCAVACVSHTTKKVLWQLGGKHNDFKDLSYGHATNIHWQHHATWHAATSELTIFDNGAYDALHTAKYSRGLRVKVDVANKTATLVRAFVAPQQHLAPSQGSVQILDVSATKESSETASETVLVGWGYIPAFTEFATDGRPLCDVHLCPTGLYHLGWCKNYRTFKNHWVGRPRTKPSAAMRPAEEAVYVSWNGATEVRSWQLQTSKTETTDDTAFSNHGAAVRKQGFEAKLAVPSDAVLVRVAALDKDGNVLAYSEAVSTAEATVVEVMPAPARKLTMHGVLYRIGVCILLVVACLGVLVWHRASLISRVRRLAARILPARSYKYDALPATMVQL